MRINSTIFKTWLNDINKVALAIDGLQSITQFKTGSTIANGMELSTVAVNKYKASIEGLSLSQAKTVLSTTALNEAQQKQILISAGLLNTTESLTLAEVKEMASSMSLSAQKKEEILTTLQGAYSEEKWNEQRLLAIKEAGGEAGAIAEVILAKKTENAENLKRIASNKSLNAVLKEQLLLLLKNPFTWIVVGTAAAVVAIDLFTESLAEAQEKAEKSKQAYDDLVSELSTLRQEADTTREKIEELQKLADNGTISLVEQNELDKLKETNEELEREIRLKEYSAQMAGKEASDDAVNAITKKSETYSTGSVDPNTPVSELPRNASQIYTAQEDRIDAFQRRIDSATVKQEELNALIEKQKEIEQSFGNEADKYTEDSEWKKLQNQVNAKKSEIQTVEKEMSDYYDALSSEDDALRDEYGNIIEGAEETVSRLEAVYKSFDLYGAGGQTAVDKVVEYFGDSNNESVVDALQDAYNSFANGDISKSSLYSMKEYQAVMSETGISASYLEQHLRDLAKAEKELGTQNPDETDISFSDIFSLKDAENNLTDLGKINEEIDKFQSSYKGLKEAMDSYNETGTFTLDQVQEIISYGGDYLKYLMDENGNLHLNEEALNKVAIARINEMRAKALSNLMDNLDKITNEEQALNYLETQLLNTATAYDALTASRIKAWSENALENGISQETINKVTKSFENQVSAINEMFNNISLDSIYKSSSSSAKKATKDAEQAIKDYIDSYMDYMEKSLESGRIDYKTYSRDVAKLLKDMYAQGKIAAKDYHDYTKEMLEVQKDIYDKALSAITGLLDDEINKIEDAIDAVEKQNDALEEQKTLMENAASAVSDYYQKLIDGIENTNDALDEQNEKLEEQLSDMDSAINAVETYYDTLVDADQKTIDNLNEKNDSIQLQIEKYDSLISVADRLYTEEQDNLKAQQDSIQEKIDLLQEENNQKDLQYRKEEALYELQRSQQQRTKKLYVGDKGYIYDTDKKAIRDAQKNLQDIETEELVSSLEKEKEALQDSIDSLQEYRDALSEISDAYQKLVDERNAAELLGEGYKNLILETNIDDWLELKDKYIQANDKIADNEDLIKSHEDKIKIWEEEKEQWSSLPQSIIDETNKQKATEKFGADWEKQINEGRFNAFDSFKKNYLDIQSKINDNTETINSNNEKIEQYNKLKEEWDSLTNSLDENTKSQAAIQMFGANWEKQINDGRLISYDAFKNQYLLIESQINDNTLLIDSYNEKIEYYENLKNQWNSVTSAYEDEMNKQYAAQIIGANWEVDILNGRLGTLDNFKNQYISIQQAIADAAWASANAQIEAAKEAEKGASGNTGDSSKKTGIGDSSKKTDTGKLPKKTGTGRVFKSSGNTIMMKYASGTSHAKKGLNLVGEDGIETFIDNEGNISLVIEPTLIPMEGGEIVKNESETKSLLNGSNLIPLQTSDLFKKLSINMPDLSSIFKTNIPNYSNLVTRNNNAQQPSIVIGDIHLHEVQNVDGLANAIIRELPNRVTQALGKR